jgi:hypothetical protein
MLNIRGSLLNLLEISVHLRIDKHNSIEDLLYDRVLVLLERLLNRFKLCFGFLVDRRLRFRCRTFVL